MAKSTSTTTAKPSKVSKAQRAIEAKAENTTIKTKNVKAVPSAKSVHAALSKPLQVSDQLAAVVGKGPLARTEVVSAVWNYIREHNLQNPENKREILADERLKAVFGQDKATMFEMNKLLSAHLS